MIAAISSNILAGLVAYTPFVSPLPVWDYWYLLLVPLSAGVAIVYKAIRCKKLSELPKEATLVTAWIVLGMMIAAIVLWIIVRWVSH